MKKIFILLFVVLGITLGFSQEDDRPENTGDNFSLEGALALFKNAKSLEDFEKAVNQENNNINNLDLNDDGDIDYIIVADIQEKDAHVIVLSTYLNENEKQDIATIQIEKTAKDEAQLQIEGDADLYAENTIVEPFETDQKLDKSKGPNTPEIIFTQVIVNVWFWPSVRFLYAPAYVVWVSPHRWGFYPHWFKPWRPFKHSIFYARCGPHRVYFHKTNVRRVVIARNVYTPRRKSSTLVVHNRRGTTVVHRNKRGNVKVAKVKRSKGGRR